MAASPLIGLPTAEDASGASPQFSLAQPYARCIAAAGGIPVLIPLLEEEAILVGLYARLAGLLLCGGGDVAAERYGARDGGRLSNVDAARDRVEILLTQHALAEGKPVLGICRGAQLLNVAAGGTLIQDIAQEMPDALAHPRPKSRAPEVLAHPVRVAEDTLLHRILFDGAMSPDHWTEVNSSHHQAVERIAPGFRAVAWAPDGVVEAIESEHPESAFLLGVQWHPEHLAATRPAMRRLFERFVQAAAQWMAEQ